jgi:hypothetical protein
LLDTVQPTGADRVAFVPVGTEADAYTHTVLKISGTVKPGSRNAQGTVWALRAGESSFVSDVCSRLPADKPAFSNFLQTVSQAQSLVTGYLISKTGAGAGDTAKPAAAAPAPTSPSSVFTAAAGAAGVSAASTKNDTAAPFAQLSTSSMES